MSSFTPGPWTNERKHPDTPEVAYVDAKNVFGVAGEICTLYQAGLSDQEFKANARLIAAAPDLYEACEDALALIEELGKRGTVTQWSGENGLRAALKKARGEA